MSTTEFKAKCLDLLDQVGDRSIGRLEITRHGRVLAVLTAPAKAEYNARAEYNEEPLHGFMRGSVVVPPDVDLTNPVLDEVPDAELGVLHR